MKKQYEFCITIAVTAVILLLLNGCNKQTYNIANDKSPDVTINTCSYDIIAHIVIEDTYTLNNETYYELHFTTDDGQINELFYDCSESFTLSETDYDKFFGEDNDAFTTTVYKMDAEVPILKYKKSKMLTDLDILEAEGIISDIVCNEDEEIATESIHEYRFSVFGESNFTDADKEAAKQEVITYGLETIEEMEELFHEHK